MIVDLVLALVQVAVVGAAAPLLTGILRTAKARLVGRQGPSPWQPYRDLRKLLGKETVVSETTSWVFRVTPYVLAGSMIVASVAVPVLVAEPPLAFAGVLLVMYVFMLGTFFLALAGLDAGSAFGGMGSSRAVAVAALAEPTVILAIFALALQAETTTLGGIVERIGQAPLLAANPGHLLAFVAFFIVLIAETGRLPVDNPATHLELTMIHEAMILEYSGPGLALIEWAGSMKLFLFMTLLANLFFPWGVATRLDAFSLVLSAGALILKLAILAGFLAFMETSVAKLRLFRVPELLAGSFALGLVSIAAVFLLR